MKHDRILRTLALLLLLTGFALPALASGQRSYTSGSEPVTTVQWPENVTAGTFEHVTVEQLEQAVAAARGKPDKKVAEQLGDLKLTERLSTARFARLKADLPGEKARAALLALADASAFLDLPATEILPNAAPDAATQGQILSRAADFVRSAVSRMPNFFATETITRFQDMKVSQGATPAILVPDHGFLVMDKRSTSVTYRNGQEILETPVGKKHKSKESSTAGLTTRGVFGPLLDVTMKDILKGKVTWGRWEQGPAGPLAVFRYVVPEGKSNYTVQYCCFRSEWGEMREFRSIPTYHGEIAIDPASGAVLRLSLKTDLQPALPIKRSDELVEYGPVELGGRAYICPVKSISITKVKALVFHESTSDSDRRDIPGSLSGKELEQTETVNDPAVTAINDIVFENYHLFRGEVRILSEDSPEPEEKAPASAPAAAPQTVPKR